MASYNSNVDEDDDELTGYYNNFIIYFIQKNLKIIIYRCIGDIMPACISSPFATKPFTPNNLTKLNGL